MTVSSRELMGPADVSDAELEQIVAESLGVPADQVELLDSRAEPVDYDLAAITTAARFWVRGTARVGGEVRGFAFFVKHIQSWSRSPLFEQVPPQFRDLAEGMVPWRTEALIYRSDFADRLPDGLAAPRALAVRDLDAKSAVVWIEQVDVVERAWGVDELTRAAYLLGRLAASDRMAPLAAVGEVEHRWTIRDYLHGRLGMYVFPALRSDELWRHPLVAAAFDPELRSRLMAAVDRAGDYVEDLMSVPQGVGHGDACTNNILVQRNSDELVLIDYGFWGTRPLGYDLGQLLLGDVQLGRRPASGLAHLESACTPAYVRGLRDERCEVGIDVVQRAHALQMLIFSGVTSIPFEHLDCPPTPELHRIAAERAASARFMLDLVDSTG
jgi:hypothetical protein